MIHLRKDFYARLAISAQKDKVTNFKFKTSRDKHESTKKALDASVKRFTGVENIIISTDIPNDSSTPTIIRNIRPKTEKVDEKVENMINNPMIKQLKAELLFAEELLKKIKADDTHNPKIPSIEVTIRKIKDLLDQKSYV